MATNDAITPEQVREMRAQLVIAKNCARRWENDSMHLRSELEFVTSQNDKLVEKLQATRRELDHYKNAITFTTPPPNQEPAIAPESW